MSKHRSFSFTWNNYDDDSEKYLRSLATKYVVFGKEIAPSTGTPHLQGMVVWPSQRSLAAVIKDLPGCHVEPARSEESLATYVAKDGNVTEWGIRPVLKALKGAGEKARWESARELARGGKLEEIDADIYIRYYRTLKTIGADNKPRPEALSVMENRWIWGSTGTGKTRGAWELHPEAYAKMTNKWWDGYADEPVVIMDDVGKTHAYLGDHLKQWVDHRPFRAEVKSGTMEIRPKIIIITSNYHPSELWGDDPNVLEPLKRRFRIEHWDPLAGAIKKKE